MLWSEDSSAMASEEHIGDQTPTPRSNKRTAKINTCISVVVRPSCYKSCIIAVGNVVVRSSLAICVKRKLSEAFRVTNPLWILCWTTLNCLAATSFWAFQLPPWLKLCTDGLCFLLRLQVTTHCRVNSVPLPLAFNRDPAFIVRNTVHSPGVY